MKLVLDIPSELEAELSAKAELAGKDLQAYLLQVLVSNPPARPPANGRELVAYWKSEQLIGTREDIEDSAKYARKLRQQSQHRELS